jgi:hypothetical protein
MIGTFVLKSGQRLELPSRQPPLMKGGINF